MRCSIILSENTETTICYFVRSRLRIARWNTGKRGTIQGLPLEIISTIVDCVEDIHDLVCLCLVDRGLFSMGVRRVLQMQEAKIATWVGDRFICLGDAFDWVALPEGVKSFAVHELGLKDEELPSFWNLVQDHFSALPEPWEVDSLLKSCTIEPRSDSDFVQRFVRSEEYDAYKKLLVPEYESSTPWVLCNAAKHEYLQVQHAALTMGCDSDDFTPFWIGDKDSSLAQLLLLSIFWSENVDLEGADDYGNWVGDRFEITTMDKMDKKAEWTDVTDRMTTVLRQVVDWW